MPARVHLTWADTGVQRWVTNLRDHLEDPEPAWAEYADWLRGEEKKQFESEGIYMGHNPWAPLSPAYAKVKARRFPGEKLLQATHRLIKSLTERGGENIARWTRATFEFGSEVPYFKFHQTGTSKMPARPPMADYNKLAAGLGRIWMRHLLYGPGPVIGDESASSEASEV